MKGTMQISQVIRMVSIWMGAATLLAGCAPSELKAPCQNYGAYCHKIPINSWNYERA